jgi:excisionase family DNA binding protein
MNMQSTIEADNRRPFSPETLADRWGCSAEKVRLMYRAGELAGFRLGKLIRIPAAEVERYECQTIHPHLAPRKVEPHLPRPEEGDAPHFDWHGRPWACRVSSPVRSGAAERPKKRAGSRPMAAATSGPHKRMELVPIASRSLAEPGAAFRPPARQGMNPRGLPAYAQGTRRRRLRAQHDQDRPGACCAPASLAVQGCARAMDFPRLGTARPLADQGTGARAVDAAKSPHIKLFLIAGADDRRAAGAILDLTWDRVDLAHGTDRLSASGARADEQAPYSGAHERRRLAKRWRKLPRRG